MKTFRLAMTALSGALALAIASSAEAGNAAVENALKSRPELSDFYHGLVSTGVLNELRENEAYTVFAPVNASFGEYPPSQYPCFYSADCRQDVARILRNHIVPGEKHLSDIYPQQGGIMSLFSLDDHHIIASEPNKDHFTVDGHKVLSENQLAAGVLYRIDGVLARPRDMARFGGERIVKVYAPGTDLPPRVPQGAIVTRTDTTIMPDGYTSHDYSTDAAY